MPNIRKMTDEERQYFEGKGKSARKQVEEEYDSILGEYEIGDYGIAELTEGDKRATVRNRLKAAAQRRNLNIAFRRTRDNTLRFQLVDPSEVDTTVDEEDDEIDSRKSNSRQRSQRRSIAV